MFLEKYQSVQNCGQLFQELTLVKGKTLKLDSFWSPSTMFVLFMESSFHLSMRKTKQILLDRTFPIPATTHQKLKFVSPQKRKKWACPYKSSPEEKIKFCCSNFIYLLFDSLKCCLFSQDKLYSNFQVRCLQKVFELFWLLWVIDQWTPLFFFWI